ncbi:hypothetical protein [Clostridium sp.]|uniref:hypothetical protein n=1 Tax=Clostridium sp. TaxID=1506 RepID=UPI0035A0E243
MYSTWGTLNLVWELILFNDSAMVLVIELIPNTGTNSFVNPTLGTTTLTLENNKSYAFIPGQEQGKAYTVQEGSYIQPNIKYLMVDGNDIKHWDISSSSYVKISELPLTADKFQSTGSGIIVFIASTDSGTSWKAWNGSAWVLVDITNMKDVKTKGMTASVLQGITEAQWTYLGISNKKIRFGWHMEITSSTDVFKLKEIRVNYSTV